jgi:streptogramin lyase
MPHVSLVPSSVLRHKMSFAATVVVGCALAAPVFAQSPPIYKTLGGRSPAGYQNATNGADAQFNQPTGVAVDASGNVYVADSMTCVIRKITPSGETSRYAGQPGECSVTDGDATTGRLFVPQGIAIDSTGVVYVGESSNTVRKITTAGSVTTLAGTAFNPGSADGTGPNARFNGPRGIAVDSAGNVYVADSFNHTIRQITPGGTVTTIAGLANNAGGVDGTGSVARFRTPSGIAVDSSGNLYVADQNNNVLRKVTPAAVVSTLAGQFQMVGTQDGTGSSARFSPFQGVTVDSAGTIYIADTFSSTIRRVTAAGVVTTVAGLGNSIGDVDGTGTAARFNIPWGITVDAAGTLYVADTTNCTIRKVTAAGVVTTLAGFRGSFGSVDSHRFRARFALPLGVAVDAAGNVYVADRWNFTIRKITPWGLATTLAGMPGVSGGTDGTGSAARFGIPRSMVLDSGGNLYVADAAHTIRKVTPAGVVTTLAGVANTAGSTDGVGSAARFNGPNGLAIDGTGLLYVTDANNHTIRTVTATGIVSTLAGAAGQQGTADGPTADARFRFPRSITVDATGNIYVADTNNHTIRKISGGTVTTLAGLAGNQSNTDGTGSAARFGGPQGIAAAADGTLYVADTNNQTIRKVTPAGVVTTIGGVWGGIGPDDGPGSEARFNTPSAIAVDSRGTLYIADSRNNTIRTTGLIRPNVGDFDSDGKAEVTIFRPSSGTFFASMSGTNHLTFNSYNWGGSGDLPVVGDFDGDSKTDPTIFRPSTGQWWILTSSSGYLSYITRTWGAAGDVPVRGDWDGDAIDDIGIFRPATGEWYALLSSENFNDYGSIVWGSPGDVAVPADYDGDSWPDIAVYRPSNGQWWILRSTEDYDYSGYFATTWGQPGDLAVPADYDGDGAADIAVFRPSNGTWYVLTSSSNFTTYVTRSWGLATDVPVPADYDGDGKTDFAVYRAGIWFVLKSSTNNVEYSAHTWGVGTDIPILKR